MPRHIKRNGMSGRGELIVTKQVAYLGVALATALSASILGLSAASAASFGTVVRAQDGSDLVKPVGDAPQNADEYYEEDPGTHVRAPFTSVDTDNKERTRVEAPFTSVDKGEDGTHIRAPFVDLFVPRR
jgi:hypothetical protein